MFRNVVTSENTEESHKEVITSQIPDQLSQIADDDNTEAIKDHFKFVLANDFYKSNLNHSDIKEIKSLQNFFPS